VAPETPHAKVSVIVPLYNVAEYIRQTMSSLLQQALRDVEFILIDDGSTDTTVSLIESMAATDPRIRLTKQDNRGPSAARNHGLRLAHGDYICFVDADDIMPHDALTVMYDAAQKYNADIVTGDTRRFRGEKTWPMPTYVKYGVTTPGPKTLRTHPELMYAIGPCAKLFQRELVGNTFFPENIRLGEDQPFVLSAYERATLIYTVDAIVYYYRQREGASPSLTQHAINQPLDALDDLYEMLRLTRVTLTEPRLFNFYLTRVMSADIWPRVRAAIKSHDAVLQIKILDSLRSWLATVDTETFRQVPELYRRPLRGLVKTGHHLRARAVPSAIRLIASILSRMNPSSYKNLVTDGHIAPIRPRRLRRTIRATVSTVWTFGVKYIMYPLLVLLPPRKTVVFASNKSGALTGNLKFLRDGMKNYPGWRVAVYSKPASKSAVRTVRLFHALARSSVVFLDDYYAQLRGLHGRSGGQIVQVWHAAGAFKKFGLSSRGAADANSEDYEVATHGAYTAVICSSSEVRALYAEAFNVPTASVLPLGLPRTDVFFDEAYKARVRESLLREHPQLAHKKILLYAPTFRGMPQERSRFHLNLDLDMLAHRLGDNYALVIKLHPSVQEPLDIPERLAKFVVDLSKSADINDLLILSDVLITDYSSVIFEYALLRRPMVFFAYDVDSYLDERGFYYEYSSFVPGPIAKTTAEVADLLENGQFDLSKIDEFADRFFDYRDGKATQRILDHFLAGQAAKLSQPSAIDHTTR